MAWSVEHHHRDVLNAFVHRASNNGQHFRNRHLDVKRIAAFFHVIDDARTVSQLRHVKRWHIPQCDLDSFLRARRCDATDGVGRALGDVGCAVDWIDGDVKLRRTGNPCSKLFTFENTGCFVLDSFANDDFAADVHEIEHAAHGVAGRCVGGFLVAAPEPSERIQGSGFRRAHKIQLDDSLDVLVISFG